MSGESRKDRVFAPRQREVLLLTSAVVLLAGCGSHKTAAAIHIAPATTVKGNNVLLVGTADPGDIEPVDVSIGSYHQTITANHGRWSVRMRYNGAQNTVLAKVSLVGHPAATDSMQLNVDGASNHPHAADPFNGMSDREIHYARLGLESAHADLIRKKLWVNGPWPFTVNYGLLRCRAGAVTFQYGRLYAINGTALDAGLPSVRPIWRRGTTTPRINISSVLAHGLTLC